MIIALFLSLVVSVEVPSMKGETGALEVKDLRVEYRVDPRGLDVPVPRLSWVLEADPARRGARQTAYRVLVAGRPEDLDADRGTLWDSGKRASDRQVEVEYGGKPLSSRMQCFWKVRVWDREGRPSPWSATASWTMGLLDRSDWKAAWIGLPYALPRKEGELLEVWIRHPEVEGRDREMFFRRAFTVAETSRKVVVELSADDRYTLYLDGKVLGEDANWRTLERFELVPGKDLPFGEHVLAVHVVNGGGDTGFVCGVLIEDVDPAKTRRLDPAGWRCAAAAAEGWADPGFTPGKEWVRPRKVAKYGEKPWGRLSYGRRPAQPGVMLRKEFTLPGPVERAVLYVTARGVYEARLNGKRVGDRLLAPEWTEYDRRIQVQAFDVTGLLAPGKNAAGVELAEGWYAGRIGWDAWPDVYGENPALLFQLEATLENGSTVIVASDGSWRATLGGPVRAAGIYDGVTYDVRREAPGWDRPGFEDGSWKAVTVSSLEAAPALVWQPSPPVGVKEVLTPQEVKEVAPGVYQFDLGQNMVGWCRVRAFGPPGTEIRVRHAERLDEEGRLYRANLRAAKAEDTYILGGDTPDRPHARWFEPRFTFHGFRYVEVEGLPEAPGKEDLQGIVISSRLRETGRIRTGNPLVDRLMENIRWGFRGNFLGIPTDCPQRDERLGWTGDILASSQAACFCMDTAAFFEKYARDLRDGQDGAGRFPDFAPRGPARNQPGRNGSPAWGDAGVVVPWRAYVNFGDRRVLEEQYAAARRWVDFIHGNNPGLLWRKERGSDYNDWVNGDTVMIEGFPRKGNAVPKEVFATAFFAESARIVSAMARALGRKEEAERYEALRAGIQQAFRKAYLEEEGRLEGDTQAGYGLALDLDLLSATDRPAAISRLLEAVHRYQGHLSTGFHAAHHVLLALTRFGRHEEACRIVNLDTPPSYGYMIAAGATTMWERWDGYVEGRGYQNPGMNSFNHHMFGAVGEWVWRCVAGLEPDPEHPGYAHFFVHPRPGPGFEKVEAEYDSVRGTIRIAWQEKEGRLRLEVTVPPGAEATVYVETERPDRVTEGGRPAAEAEGVTLLGAREGCAVFRVGSGTYTFEG